MTVYIVNYYGTIYGVFDSREKAEAYVIRHFGIHHTDCILTRAVE